MTDIENFHLRHAFGSPQQRRITRRGHGPHPKPNVIPIPKRLAHLPVDRFGYPIPWVSDWTGTTGPPPNWQPVPGHPEWGDYDNDESGYGVGHPLPGNLGPGRQVRAMVNRLCGTCGKKMNGKVIFMGAITLVHEGFREPPVHPACAEYAIRACPGINRGRIVIVEAVTYDLRPLWMGRDLELTFDPDPLGLPQPVVYVIGFPARGDRRNKIYTVASWTQARGVDPHPHLDGGFPVWSLDDVEGTHPDIVDPQGDAETHDGTLTGTPL
jgi:hypothetical protein